MSRIACVLADDFEDSEFCEPRDGLLERGHDLVIIGSRSGEVTGKHGTTVEIDAVASDVSADQFDGLLIPGGFSPDRLRTDDSVVDLVAKLMARDLPVAAVCHAPSLLIEAGVVDGRTMTSWPSIRTDLRNAGATVVDEELVRDGNLITSRKPDDLPAFVEALLGALDASPSEPNSH